MERRITVKGTGTVTKPVDWIIVKLTLETVNKEYDYMIEMHNEKYQLLIDALISTGIEKDAIQTSYYNIDKKTERKKDRYDNYYDEFIGYRCIQRLEVAFDYDMTFLGDVLSSITNSHSNADFRLTFTVKDGKAVSLELLKKAALNAKEKAEILCAGVGCQLGPIIDIDYDWHDIYFESDMEYSSSVLYESAPMDMKPKDIEASDNARFVWEIID